MFLAGFTLLDLYVAGSFFEDLPADRVTRTWEYKQNALYVIREKRGEACIWNRPPLRKIVSLP
jgi:hypothetical protein